MVLTVFAWEINTRKAAWWTGTGATTLFGGTGASIIIDHCSMSWSTDEVFKRIRRRQHHPAMEHHFRTLNYSITLKRATRITSITGSAVSGRLHLSAHHNLFAHCKQPEPTLQRHPSYTTELVDYRNNVIYNWGINTIYAGEGGSYNIVNNYFKYGPNTNAGVRYRIVNPRRDEKIGFGKCKQKITWMEAKDVTANNWLGIHMGNKGTEEDKRIRSPANHMQLNSYRHNQPLMPSHRY